MTLRFLPISKPTPTARRESVTISDNNLSSGVVLTIGLLIAIRMLNATTYKRYNVKPPFT